jgi:hypothetical protein
MHFQPHTVFGSTPFLRFFHFLLDFSRLVGYGLFMVKRKELSADRMSKSSKDERRGRRRSIYGGIPARILDMRAGDLGGFRRYLQDIENQVRREKDYDHAGMRRADAVRMSVWMRVLTRLAVEDLGLAIMERSGEAVHPATKLVFETFYKDNRDEMKLLLKATKKELGKAADLDDMTDAFTAEIMESMAELGRMERGLLKPEAEEPDAAE